MGQRHQIFVIVRTPRGYRSLAALHHQWLYEVKAVERCLRLLKIFGEKANRIPITQEIRAAHEHSDELWKTKDVLQPFPFIATCLIDHTLAFNTSLEQVDNNDGITLIDLTDLDNLRYCFATLDNRLCHRSQRSVSLSEPLGTYEYLAGYAKLQHEDSRSGEESGSESGPAESYSSLEGQALDTAIDREYGEYVYMLDSYEVIDASALRSVWSREDSIGDDTPASPTNDELGNLQPHSLRDHSMDQLIVSALKDSSLDLDSLVDAKQLPDFMPKLRGKLSDLALANEISSSQATVDLLLRAFSGESSVDLNAFHGLKCEQLVEAATEILNHRHATSLNLSHLRQLDEDVIAKVLQGSRLETLYLLEMPQISVDCISALQNQSGSHITDVYHTELLRRPLMVATLEYTDLKPALHKSLPFASSTSAIKQIFWACTDFAEDCPNLRKPNSLAIDWQNSQPLFDLSDDFGKMQPAVFPLQDIVLSPSKLVAGLSNFLTCALQGFDSREYQGMAAIGFTMAKSLALSSSCLGEQPLKIGHLPYLLYGSSEIASRVVTAHWPVPLPEMKVGEWTAVIVNEHWPYAEMKRKQGTMKEEDEEKFRLSLIMPKTAVLEDCYRVESMQSFLEDVIGKENGVDEKEIADLLSYWNDKAGFVAMCEKEEVHELVPAFRSNVQALRDSPEFGTAERKWNRH